MVTSCVTNRFQYTALPGFPEQASKFVNGSLKECEILDLGNRMLRVRESTHLLSSKFAGIFSISGEQSESSTSRCSLALQAVLKHRVLSISRISKRKPMNCTGQTKSAHTERPSGLVLDVS